MARLSKRFKVGKVTRINVSRKGIGSSVGTKGFRVGAGPRGIRVTAKNPITDKSMQVRSSSGRRESSRRTVHAPSIVTSAGGVEKRGKGCCLWPFVLIMDIITASGLLA